MTQTEALRLALEALEWSKPHADAEITYQEAMTAIKAALLSRSDGEAKDEPVAHSVVAGALFDFMGWLTSREKRLILSSVDEASPAVEAITEFAKKRNLSLKYAEVGYWMEFLSTPPRQEAKDEPVAQWQKKHATKTEGKWENTNGPDAKWWLNNSVGWEIRALYTHPPQQEAKDEPVAWMYSPTGALFDICPNDADEGEFLPLYTNPPQRTWVKLTEEEIKPCWYEACQTDLELTSQLVVYFARAIEAKLKEKNT